MRPRRRITGRSGLPAVIYSRVLRDCVLYAMTHQLIRVMWSAEILDEAVEHLIENVDGFDEASGERLVRAMNGTFEYSQVEVTDEARASHSRLHLDQVRRLAQHPHRRGPGDDAQGASHRGGSAARGNRRVDYRGPPRVQGTSDG